MKVFKDLFETGNFVRSLNTTFLGMVPKKERLEEFKDYRPISSVVNLYKLITKVLAKRLKNVVSKLVNKAQHAFVEGRQIIDAPLIANEVVDSLLGRKEKWVLCKLDIEKAYDQINWKFLLTALQKMDFGRK